MSKDWSRSDVALKSQGEVIDFVKEAEVLIEQVQLALEKGGDNPVSKLVLPLCTKLYGIFFRKYHEDEIVPPEVLKEILGLMVLSYTFAEWIQESDLVAEEVTVTPSEDELMELCESLVETVENQITFMNRNLRAQLASYYQLDESLIADLPLAEIPDVVRRGLQEQGNGND